jgi:hypothetical protein
MVWDWVTGESLWVFALSFPRKRESMDALSTSLSIDPRFRGDDKTSLTPVDSPITGLGINLLGLCRFWEYNLRAI